MVKTIIPNYKQPGYVENRTCLGDGSPLLYVSECFSDTLQGEGISSGAPSTFLRMKNCTLNCQWCDSLEVFKHGNVYTVKELANIFDKEDVIRKLEEGQRLILTGGSPLKQQESLEQFLKIFPTYYGFRPYTEIENECVIRPNQKFISYIDQWNNSPKLSNSGMKPSARYKQDVIKYTASLNNSWFKFVIGDDMEKDWQEVIENFLVPKLINREQIILMPEGSNREQLQKRYKDLVDLCCRELVRFSDRLQVTIFGEVVGV